MALISVSNSAANINLGTADDVFVAQTGSIASAGFGIWGTGSQHSVTVAGTVFGQSAGVVLGDSATLDSFNTVRVTTSGQVVSEAAIALSLTGINGLIENLGLIQGIGITGTPAETSDRTQIVNHAVITNIGSAIRNFGSEAIWLTNTGTVWSDQWALYFQQKADDRIDNAGRMTGSMLLEEGDDRLTNSGTITGQVLMDEGDDLVVNRGVIEGSVNLGAGNDSYEGLWADPTRSPLFLDGNAGNDAFLVSARTVEIVAGGDGRDTVRLQTGGAASTVYLDGREGSSGAAAGDLFFSVEVVFATSRGDRIFGATAAEAIDGGLGGDTLSGGGGADTLTGGGARDRLTGGTGNDVFVFATPGEGGDAITDFRNVGGNNDTIQISVAGFGAGLLAGPLTPSQFRARTDNAAQDADDRFIFRTTDKTLWFDANGNAAGGLTLVADLQAGATFGLADIVLV